MKADRASGGRGRDFDSVPASTLRQVEGAVRSLKQLLGRGTVLWINRNSLGYRHRTNALFPNPHVHALYGSTDTASAMIRRGQVRLRHDNDELLSSISAYDVFLAKLRYEPFGHFLQQPIPRGVAVAIVELLEVIDVRP